MAKKSTGIAQNTRREIVGVFLVALAIIAYLALAGEAGGTVGTAMARGLRHVFGVMAWWVPALVAAAGVARLLNRTAWPGASRALALVLASFFVDALIGLWSRVAAGVVGFTVATGLTALLGRAGSLTLLLALLIAAALVLTGGSLENGLRLGGRALLWTAAAFGAGGLQMVRSLRDWVFPPDDGAEVDVPASLPPAPDPGLSPPPPPPRVLRTKPAPREDQLELTPAPEVPVKIHPHPASAAYTPPPLALLERPVPGRGGKGGRSPQERGALLVDTLHQFGIAARLGDVSQGPAVTRFEVIPPPGVKVSKIVNLADDMALALAATGVRIEAPIPGKSAIGIEVPNEDISTVWLREVLESTAFQQARSPLTVALGKDIAGQPMVAALDAMPHLLVAGATGSGKSVLINVLISSLLFRAGPELMRLLLIDPKVVELNGYNGIPHLLTPVVTDPKKASQALRWGVREMERRYQLFAQAGVRDIGRYNQSGAERIPYIVIVIDELADLMMVAPVEVEESIARLAQMARAAGLHLVVATQRPSVDVITGTIKANIPSRIAFAVSSQIDSRTILDQAGAEKLLGRGDMLFHPVGAAKPVRVQGALVQESEIEKVVALLRQRTEDQESIDDNVVEFTETGEGAAIRHETDALFEEALRIVVESRQASASMLQRRLRVGYTRAARLVDSMAERGYVGPADGARPRDVYLSVDQFERLFQSDEPSSS